jgi:hypothetical protein
MEFGRRAVVKGAALSALVFTLDGVDVALSPRQARAADIPITILTPAEKASLEAFGDVLLPGAKEAGIAYFVDHQLGVAPGEALLVARSMNVPPPFVNFYRAGLKAFDAAAQKAQAGGFTAMAPAQQADFVRAMMKQNPDGWTGPPSPFFYAVVRLDATDVVYGTVEGFERLGVPYMPHLLPERSW